MSDHSPQLTPLFHITVLHRATTALLAEAMRESPWSPGDYAIGCAIEDQAGIGASDLAHQFSVPLTTVTEWLNRLRDRGLIRRERDPSDGRRQQLALTDEGVRTLAEARVHFGRGYTRWMDHLATSPELASEQLTTMASAAQEALAELRGSPEER